MSNEVDGNKIYKAYLDRWKIIQKLESEEQKKTSVLIRWRQLNSIVRMAIGLQLSFQNTENEENSVYLKWSKIKEKYQ